MRLTAALLFLSALPAAAQGPRQAMFPSDGSCYLRHYNGGHLAKHPDQMVTEINLGPEYGQSEADLLILRVAVQARDSHERYRSIAYCDANGGSLSCALAGEGGRFTLSPANKGALMLKVGPEPLVFKGASGYFAFGPGVSDDNAFLIPPVPADSCP